MLTPRAPEEEGAQGRMPPAPQKDLGSTGKYTEKALPGLGKPCAL